MFFYNCATIVLWWIKLYITNDEEISDDKSDDDDTGEMRWSQRNENRGMNHEKADKDVADELSEEVDSRDQRWSLDVSLIATNRAYSVVQQVRCGVFRIKRTKTRKPRNEAEAGLLPA